MKGKEQQLLRLLGEDKFVKLCKRFGNQKIPSQKCINRIKKKRFLKMFRGKALDEYAAKVGVSRATIYLWIKDVGKK